MHFTKEDNHWMQHALRLADAARQAGEVPVGAILVKDGQVIGEGFNQPISQHDPSAHAEIVALRQAANEIENYRLVDTTLYVTLEPCLMCVGAMVHARVKRLIYAASDPKTGAVHSVANLFELPFLNHTVETQCGLLAEDAAEKLRAFFKERR